MSASPLRTCAAAQPRADLRQRGAEGGAGAGSGLETEGKRQEWAREKPEWAREGWTRGVIARSRKAA